jgi:sigma-B regulation protein RsbU (phosphoserine phosphatase)
MGMPIKTKILAVILSTSLGAVVLLSITGMTSILNLRQLTLGHSDRLGSTAAGDSQNALEVQVRNQLMSLAQDRAALTDEKLNAIQNQTRMIADVATRIYTYKNQYAPKFIDYLQPSQAGQLIPHVGTAPGVSIAQFRDEIYRAANIGDILRQCTVVDIGIMGSYIGTREGYSIIVEVDAPPMETDYDARTRNWYRGAQAKDGIFWTDVFADASGKGASISCAMPFYEFSGGRKIFKGVAGNGTILSENVNKIIDSTKIGKTGYAFLLNEKGHVIMTPKKEHIVSDAGVVIGEDYLGHEDPAVRELARRMVNRESGIMELALEGQNVYVAYHPLNAIAWSLGVVGAIDEIIAPAKFIEQEILALTKETSAGINKNILFIVLAVAIVIVVVALITILAAIRLSNSLTAPILSLSDGARIISAGDVDHRLEVKTGDEIEMLADTFNKMIVNIKEITGEKERIGAELNVAATIQVSMLPSTFPAFPDRPEFDIFAVMYPAKEVGGDFYDFFMVDEDNLAVIVADVSGKGVPAALFMVISKTLLKTNAMMGKPLDEIFYTVNNQLCENNEARSNMFVTAFMGILNISTGRFSYVNAGHNPPVVRQGNGDFTWLNVKPGLVLACMEDMKFTVMEITLAKDDIVFMYTDGVTEALNEGEELFGNNRMLSALNADSVKGLPLQDYIAAMLEEIRLFAGKAEQADDITMLMLQPRIGGRNSA